MLTSFDFPGSLQNYFSSASPQNELHSLKVKCVFNSGSLYICVSHICNYFKVILCFRDGSTKMMK